MRNEECLSLVHSPNSHRHRAVLQRHWNLTDEQMEGMDIHHNPPRCEGGRNIPEHLYLYHPQTHKLIHGTDNEGTEGWGGRSKGNTNGRRGKPPEKTEPTLRDLEVYSLRKDGMNRQDIAKHLNLREHQVKRCLMECYKFGYPLIKGRGKGGYEGCRIPCPEEKRRRISNSLRKR